MRGVGAQDIDARRRSDGRVEQGWNCKAISLLQPAHHQIGNCDRAGVIQRQGSRLVKDHGLDSRVGSDAIGGPASRRANGRATACGVARDADSVGIDAVDSSSSSVGAAGEQDVDHQGQVADAGDCVIRVQRHDGDEPVAGHGFVQRKLGDPLKIGTRGRRRHDRARPAETAMAAPGRLLPRQR